MGFTHALEKLFLGLGLTVIEKVKKNYNKKIKAYKMYGWIPKCTQTREGCYK